MRHIFIILFLITLISCSRPQPLETIEEGKFHEISLSIDRSFHNTILISISYWNPQNPAKIEVIKFSKGYDKKSKVIAKRNIDKKVFSELYNQGFNMDFKKIQEKSGARGLDGSTWTLKLIKVNSVLSLSIWEPTYGTKNRGLNDFLNYCKKLINLSEVQIPENEFY